MIRLLLIILLLLSSSPAFAEWVMVSDDSDEAGLTVYVDPDTIRRNGDLVKSWELLDFKTVQTVAGNSFLSTKAQDEYDCAEERMRNLAITNFSGNMGRGKVFSNKSGGDRWHPVGPESLGQRLMEVACRKWMTVRVDNELRVTMYIDVGTIRRNGDLVKMWHLYDYQTVQSPPYLSMKRQYEYDCTVKRMRDLKVSVYSGNMERGKVMHTDSTEGKWEPVQKGIEPALWKIACGKK